MPLRSTASIFKIFSRSDITTEKIPTGKITLGKSPLGKSPLAARKDALGAYLPPICPIYLGESVTGPVPSCLHLLAFGSSQQRSINRKESRSLSLSHALDELPPSLCAPADWFHVHLVPPQLDPKWYYRILPSSTL